MNIIKIMFTHKKRTALNCEISFIIKATTYKILKYRLKDKRCEKIKSNIQLILELNGIGRFFFWQVTKNFKDIQSSKNMT